MILEDYGKGVMQPFLLREVVKSAKAQKPVLVDPKEKHFDYYTGVTCITPNRKEAYGDMKGWSDTGVKCRTLNRSAGRL